MRFALDIETPLCHVCCQDMLIRSGHYPDEFAAFYLSGLMPQRRCCSWWCVEVEPAWLLVVCGGSAGVAPGGVWRWCIGVWRRVEVL